MGKNTMIRTALRKRIDVLTEQDESGESALGHNSILENVNGNMGFIFCHTAGAMTIVGGFD